MTATSSGGNDEAACVRRGGRMALVGMTDGVHRTKELNVLFRRTPTHPHTHVHVHVIELLGVKKPRVARTEMKRHTALFLRYRTEYYVLLWLLPATEE